MSAAADEYTAIAPEPAVVLFKGRDVTILPLSVGKLPAFARAVRPFADRLNSFDKLDADAILGLIADHGEKVLEAVSIASGVTRKEIDEADPVELIALASKAIKVNADFFGRRLAQMAPAMAGLFGVGRTPSQP
jgi:hypothetical protein